MVQNKTLKNISFSLSDIDIIRNFDIKENIPLRNTVSGLVYVFPYMREPIDLYLEGSLSVLTNAKFFTTNIATRSLIDKNFFDIAPDVGENLLIDKFSNKIIDAYNPVVDFNKGLSVNLNAWADIKSRSPLVLLDDSCLLRDIHQRISSPDRLTCLFDKFWDVYESSVKRIPQGQLLNKYGDQFFELVDAMNLIKSKGAHDVYLPPKLGLVNNKSFDEGLSIFKEQYHDVLLERKLNKYFG